MRDIYELLRQKESEVERLTKEVEALRIAASLLDDGFDSATRALTTSASGSRDSQTYSAPAVARPATAPAASPTPWTSAKQFP